MRYASVAMALMALCLSTVAFGGANPQVTLPLHAKASTFEQCGGYLPVDCTGPIGGPLRPVVNLPAGSSPAVFLFANNYANIAGVQTAFDFGGLTLTFGLWDCQTGQLSAVTPQNPGGATAGSITTAFNCVNSGALLIVGRMHFTPGSGCISQVQSTFPFGIHVVDCTQGVDQIPDSQQVRLGKICVATQGGVDACDPVSAVEPTTWGSIKGQYN